MVATRVQGPGHLHNVSNLNASTDTAITGATGPPAWAATWEQPFSVYRTGDGRYGWVSLAAPACPIRRKAKRWVAKSHGKDAFLAAVHRDQPRLELGIQDSATGATQAVTLLTYRSAGVFIDSAGESCLVLRPVRLAVQPAGSGAAKPATPHAPVPLGTCGPRGQHKDPKKNREDLRQLGDAAQDDARPPDVGGWAAHVDEEQENELYGIVVYSADRIDGPVAAPRPGGGRAAVRAGGRWRCLDAGWGRYLDEVWEGGRMRVQLYGPEHGTPDVPYDAVLASQWHDTVTQPFLWLIEARAAEWRGRDPPLAGAAMAPFARHRTLAAVHRDHPVLVYGWPRDGRAKDDAAGLIPVGPVPATAARDDAAEHDAEPELVDLYRIERYESGGLWYDPHMVPCLVIRAAWGGRDGASVLILYEHQRRLLPAAVTGTEEWAIESAGHGTGLTRDGATGVVLPKRAGTAWGAAKPGAAGAGDGVRWGC